MYVEHDVCNDALHVSLDGGDVTPLYGPPVTVMPLVIKLETGG